MHDSQCKSSTGGEHKAFKTTGRPHEGTRKVCRGCKQTFKEPAHYVYDPRERPSTKMCQAEMAVTLTFRFEAERPLSSGHCRYLSSAVRGKPLDPLAGVRPFMGQACSWRHAGWGAKCSTATAKKDPVSLGGPKELRRGGGGGKETMPSWASKERSTTQSGCTTDDLSCGKSNSISRKVERRRSCQGWTSASWPSGVDSSTSKSHSGQWIEGKRSTPALRNISHSI